MSVAIETTEELLTLLKKLGIKVTNVDDLRGLLATIHANYNSEAARTRTAKLVGISVPCTLAGVAGLASVMLTGPQHGTTSGAHLVGALAVVWGTSALVSLAALIFSFSLLLSRRPSAASDKAPSVRPPLENRLSSGITPDLTL